MGKNCNNCIYSSFGGRDGTSDRCDSCYENDNPYMSYTTYNDSIYAGDDDDDDYELGYYDESEY